MGDIAYGLSKGEVGAAPKPEFRPLLLASRPIEPPVVFAAHGTSSVLPQVGQRHCLPASSSAIRRVLPHCVQLKVIKLWSNSKAAK